MQRTKGGSGMQRTKTPVVMQRTIANTPKEAMLQFCKKCVGGNGIEIRTCGSSNCPFYKFRLGDGRPKIRLFREQCLICMGGDRNMITACQNKKCPIYKYRFGSNPNR